jgi:hypothetical protein
VEYKHLALKTLYPQAKGRGREREEDAIQSFNIILIEETLCKIIHRAHGQQIVLSKLPRTAFQKVPT